MRVAVFLRCARPEIFSRTERDNVKFWCRRSSYSPALLYMYVRASFARPGAGVSVQKNIGRKGDYVQIVAQKNRKTSSFKIFDFVINIIQDLILNIF